MPKFILKTYKGYKIGNWKGDNLHFIFEEHIEKPIVGENVTALRKSMEASVKLIDRLTKQA